MGLGNLRDQLLQAGLVSEEDAKKAEEAAAKEARRQAARKGGGRPDRRGKGRRGRPEGGEAVESLQLTPEELAAAEAKKAERARQAELQREKAENRKRAQRERQLAEDVRRVAGALGLETSGTDAFFFQSRKGKVKRILVDAELRAKIEAGELAIIEHPLPHAVEFAVVPREGAEAVLGIDPRAVRFYNRSPEEFVGGKV
ncbi:MAG: DUF2058 family protein [Deltaproteobacteria bacterium]|nr:DUF2058 family protein [Deltaproteobacteria bacterium]